MSIPLIPKHKSFNQKMYEMILIYGELVEARHGKNAELSPEQIRVIWQESIALWNKQQQAREEKFVEAA